MEEVIIKDTSSEMVGAKELKPAGRGGGMWEGYEYKGKLA